MKYIRVVALIGAIAVAAPSVAVAHNLTASQAAAVATAVNVADGLSTPANPAEVNQEVPRLQPYVRAVIAQGDAAIVSLYTHTTKVPAVSATLLQDLPQRGVPSQTVSSSLSPLSPLNSGCNSGQFWYKIYLGPIWVGNLSLRENHWCGNGRNITYSEDALIENVMGITFCYTQYQFVPRAYPSASHQYASENDKTGTGVHGACDTLGSQKWYTGINWYGNLNFTGLEGRW